MSKSLAELHQRDRPSVYWAGKDRAALTKAGVKSWVALLGKAAVVAFELQPAHLLGGQLCVAPGCSSACGQHALCGGSFVGLCDAHLAEQCIGGSFEGVTWSVNGCCVSCWSEVDASDSWLLSSSHCTWVRSHCGSGVALGQGQSRSVMPCM